MQMVLSIKMGVKKEKAKKMIMGIIERVRKSLKEFSMGMEWNAGVSGNFNKMNRWKSVSAFLRREGDVPTDEDRRNLHLKSIVKITGQFPHDETDRDEAIQSALDYVFEHTKDDPVTIDEVNNFIDAMDEQERNELLPIYSQSRIKNYRGVCEMERERVETFEKYAKEYESQCEPTG